MPSRRSIPGALGTLTRGVIFSALASLSKAELQAQPVRTISDPHAAVSERNLGARPVPIEDLFFTRSALRPAWSPDAKEVVFTTNLTGRFNLWKVSTEGGWPLTRSDDYQDHPTWSPDGQFIVYDPDHAGDEMEDLYLVPATGGESQNLTQTDAVAEKEAVWSPDGTQLAFLRKEKSAPNTNLALLDLASRTLRMLTDEHTPDRLWETPVWSPDGQTLYATRRNTLDTDGDVYRLGVGSGAQENLTPHEGQILTVLGAVSSEDKFLLISREQNGVLTPALLDLRTKDVALLTAPGWESFPGSFAPDASALTYFVNEDGQMTTYVMDLKTQVAAALPFPPGVTRFSGSAALFSPDGKRLLIEHSNSQAPADLWIYQRKDKTLRQLTFSALASLKPSALPASHLVHYRSFDGTIISAFLWLPFNLERNQKHPAVVLVHGRPASQSLASFNRTAAALASRGFLCMAPNVRGSSGYGAAFQKANYQDPGGGDLQDEVYATRFLVATGYVDANRVGITGGSYGGYLTLMAPAKTPEVWAAGVEWYGIMDWRTLAQHSDPFIQQYLRGLLGDPEQNRRIYERCSASQYLDGIRAPLLVLQGINDIRVPKEQADQLVSVLQRSCKVVEGHYYENEGHGFVKRENQIDPLRRTVDWLEKYLR